MMYTSYCRKMSHDASACQAEASFSRAYNNAIALTMDANIVASIIICALICLVAVRLSVSVSVVVSILVLAGLYTPIMRTRT